MSADGASRDPSAGRPGETRHRESGRAEIALRGVQAVLALWLVISPVVLQGPNAFVAAKDVLVGGVLLTLTVAAASTRTARRYEAAVCVALGALLIVASVLVEFGPGTEAAARQWSEVVVGVLLVCLGAARTR